MAFHLADRECLSPTEIIDYCQKQGLPTDWAGLPNRVMCSLGPKPGRTWVLMKRGDLESFDYEDLLTLRISDGGGTPDIVIFNQVFIRARCVTPGQANDPEAAMLVELRDIRHLACNEYYGRPIMRSYNVRAPSGVTNGDATSYYESTLSDGQPWAWGEMLSQIWWELTAGDLEDIFGDVPLLPFAPDGIPEGFVFQGVSAWMAYNEILRRLGCAIRLDPTREADQLSIVRIGDEDDAFVAAESRLADIRWFDEEVVESEIAKIPETVTVIFHAYAKHRGNESTTTSGLSNWLTSTIYAVDVVNPNEDDLAIPGTSAFLYDDMPAIYNEDDELVNEEELDQRADERAADYYRAITGCTILHRYYIGFHHEGVLPGPLVTGIAWHERGNGFLTEIIRHPPGLWPDEKAQWSMGDWPSERLKQPDLGRATPPASPPLVHVAKIEQGTTTPHLYDAVVRRLNPSTLVFSDLEPCFVFSLDGSDLTIGNHYGVRLCGTTWGTIVEDQETRPLYVVVGGASGGGDPVVIDVTLGAGTINNWNPDGWASADVVLVSLTGSPLITGMAAGVDGEEVDSRSVRDRIDALDPIRPRLGQF
ncbi:MAG TPA: hypothetical protein PJ982_13135 [Lacipirellulaceae bacterium]|nr:hypothetical protein [Lacipirellulaceae bacterium]